MIEGNGTATGGDDAPPPPLDHPSAATTGERTLKRSRSHTLFSQLVASFSEGKDKDKDRDARGQWLSQGPGLGPGPGPGHGPGMQTQGPGQGLGGNTNEGRKRAGSGASTVGMDLQRAMATIKKAIVKSKSPRRSLSERSESEGECPYSKNAPFYLPVLQRCI